MGGKISVFVFKCVFLCEEIFLLTLAKKIIQKVAGHNPKQVDFLSGRRPTQYINCFECYKTFKQPVNFDQSIRMDGNFVGF